MVAKVTLVPGALGYLTPAEYGAQCRHIHRPMACDIKMRSYKSQPDSKTTLICACWLCQLELAPGGRLEVAPRDGKLSEELPQARGEGG